MLVSNKSTATEDVALVTPSFSRDFELCKVLNRSILAYFPPSVKHYVIVDGVDVALFRQIESNRTIILAAEDIVPKGITKLPKLNRWLAPGVVLPISGWLIQQIIKLSAAHALKESILVMVDSDVVFVRQVDPAMFCDNGAVRLYKQRDGIQAGMLHVEWHQNACRLLGLPVEQPPMDDYIGNMISWKRSLVLEMTKRVEAVTGSPWHVAIARARRFSEYLLYGLFVERCVNDPKTFWIDEHSRCHCHWLETAIADEEIARFVASMREDDVAFMITSHSATTTRARARAVSLATRGRIEWELSPT